MWATTDEDYVGATTAEGTLTVISGESNKRATTLSVM